MLCFELEKETSKNVADTTFNVLEIDCILAHVQFTTSETALDIQHKHFRIRAVERVAE